MSYEKDNSWDREKKAVRSRVPITKKVRQSELLLQKQSWDELPLPHLAVPYLHSPISPVRVCYPRVSLQKRKGS